jgi:translation initiation factor IF-3
VLGLITPKYVLAFLAGGINPLFILVIFGRWLLISNELRINEEIRAKEIRVVSFDGEQLGIISVKDALRIALEKELDLVEVAPTAKPPVCRIMDYGKYRYEQSKREREARKKQKVIEVKEIRMTPKIEEHDFQVKVKAAQKFLNDGDKVKAIIRFRGREIVHADLGKTLLKQLFESVQENAIMEREPKIEGKNMIMILSCKSE